LVDRPVQDWRPSRRQLLAAGLVASGALVAAGAGPEAQPRAVTVATGRRLAAPARRASPSPPAPPPSPLPTQARPVFTLAEFRRLVPGPAFPADAIALTIDDGPHPVWTPHVLRLLHKYHVPALFCMIGNQVLGHEPVARNVVDDGHHVANHTWSHPSTLKTQSKDQVHREIQRAQAKIYETTGYTPTLFRAPGGEWSPPLFAETARARMVPLDWSDDPRDWTKPGVQAITSRLLAARPGQILLCHDGGGDRSQTFTALQTVIPALQARGLRFVALEAVH
jgi:peptidoglycan/xylan/chitin deacetylase (PgdA/CDA1 family)